MSERPPEAPDVELHPVKVETFDTHAMINVDPKGFHRQVERFDVVEHGLYMARGADHPRFGYLESWLLPELHLRANIFHFRPGANSERMQFYFDIATIEHRGSTWTTRDLYVDIVTRPQQPAEVWDLDELAAATAAGLLSARDSEIAMTATLNAVRGMDRYGDPMAWLCAEGYELRWAKKVVLAEPQR